MGRPHAYGTDGIGLFFFSSRRRHTRLQGDWFRRVLFRSVPLPRPDVDGWHAVYRRLAHTGARIPRDQGGVLEQRQKILEPHRGDDSELRVRSQALIGFEKDRKSVV